MTLVWLRPSRAG